MDEWLEFLYFALGIVGVSAVVTLIVAAIATALYSALMPLTSIFTSLS